jgi:UDP-glucose-4-epimerase GalE
MAILVTGGAGFIGRHTAKLLCNRGMRVILLDNLTTGRRSDAGKGELVLGDIENRTLVRRVLREHGVTQVIHLAASAHVGDSMQRPDAYYANNVAGTAALLEAMVAENVLQLVFASSCSVYGNSASTAAHEDEAVVPMSPYGESKLVTERALPWYGLAFGLRWVALRYFNVAGAEDAMGEDLAGCRRIIPRTIHAALNEGSPLKVFGTSFQTCDGSAVRDYVHVSDVARANLAALQFLERGSEPAVINIGAGKGISVLRIIEEVELQCGRAVPHQIAPAREGDPGCAISDASRAREILGWTPRKSELHSIVASVLHSNRLRSGRSSAN